MKVDYLSEFGFRLSDYGEYPSGAGEGRGRAAGLRPPRGAGGAGGAGAAGALPDGRAGAPFGLAGRPGPQTRATSINSFSFSLINSRAERSCSACAMPERESERGGRGSFALPPQAPFAFLPRSRGLVGPSMGGAASGGGDAAGVERGTLRETKQIFFPPLFFFRRSAKSLGPRRGEWILVQVLAGGNRGDALSLFFRFFYGSYYF